MESPEIAGATAEEVSDSDSEVLTFLVEEAGHRLDQQHAAIAQLDTKAAGLVAAGIALASYLAAGETNMLGWVAVALNAGLLVVALSSLGVRTWADAPAPTQLLDLLPHPLDRVTDVVLRAKIQAYNENQTNLLAKSDWVKIATWFLGLSVPSAALAQLT